MGERASRAVRCYRVAGFYRYDPEFVGLRRLVPSQTARDTLMRVARALS